MKYYITLDFAMKTGDLGFIAVWIDNKVYYFNLDTISHLVMNEMYLER